MRPKEDRREHRGGLRGDQRSGHRGRGAGWVVPILGLLTIAAGPVPRAAADPVDSVPIYGSSFGAVPFHVSIDDIVFFGRVTAPITGGERIPGDPRGAFYRALGSPVGGGYQAPELAGRFTIVNCETGTLFTGVPCGSTGGRREIVPEPATGLLLAAGLAACALPGARRRARLQSAAARDSR